MRPTYSLSTALKFGLIGFLAGALTACGDDATEPGSEKPKISENEITGKVIYGDDNRQDVYEVQDQTLRELAGSTAALIYYGDLAQDGANTLIRTSKYANSLRLPLCETEKFREQDTAAFCSGFLIAPNIMATAGHCIQTQGSSTSDCTTTKFIFGFNLQSSDDRPTSVPSTEVYSCKRIIKQTLINNGADFSIIELDRAVVGHAPLKIRKAGAVAVKDELLVIGHPSGLPTKISGGATVRAHFPSFIRADLDTYGGNSGSAVFNAKTKEVEGILVRGETDFISQGGCMTSKRCGQNECRGEDVTKISELLPYL